MTCTTARRLMMTEPMDSHPQRDECFGHLADCPQCSEWLAACRSRGGVPKDDPDRKAVEAVAS